METPSSSSVILVSVQSVEWYGERYYKFKGGFAILVRTDKEATAFGLVLEYLVANNLASGYYPRHAEAFASEEEALASLPEWDREFREVL
jgi:hypothetical protein